MSARLELVEYLKALMLGTEGLEDVRVIPSVRAVDSLSKPVLIVKTNTYERVPEQPRLIRGNFTLTLVSPHVNIDRAEADLEDMLELLLPALYTAQLLFGEATQVGYDDTHIGYDITLMSLLS
jgi:hypothetical protein